MTDTRIGTQGDIEVDPRVVKEQAQQTVRSLLDAVVELVTNSDDSYRRMDLTGGKIKIKVRRLKGGKWSLLQIEDSAQGMSIETLIEALKYGTKSSGFSSGSSVRGLWGRGMKETIISFGSGEIRTCKDGREAGVKVWWDSVKRNARWEIIENTNSTANNGTVVSVFPAEGSGGKCNEFESLYNYLCNHYAFRGIIQDRTVTLEMMSTGGRWGKARASSPKKLKYKLPKGELVLETSENTSFGQAQVKIWQSSRQLTFNRWNPYSTAGIIIKTQGVPLDNSLFGFEDDAGQNFFGEINCPELANLIRQDLSLLTTTRTGIDWHQEKCQEFENAMKLVLEPLVRSMRNNIASESAPKIDNIHKNRLLKMLNELANKEFEIATDDNGPGPGSSAQSIDKLTVKPEMGFATPGEPRNYSVYIPVTMAKIGDVVNLTTIEVIGAIQLSNPTLSLAQHPQADNLLWGHFTLSGSKLGENTWIQCSIFDQETLAYFEVKNETLGTKKKTRTGTGGGFFKDIRANTESNPSQRVAYRNGIIEFFTEFPVVKEYVIANRLNTSEGKVLFAEMMSELVCATISRKRIYDGLVPGRPTEDASATIPRFEAEVNRIKIKCSALIHRWAQSYKIDGTDSGK